ncbi:MAG: 3-oxoacyl-ACP reductase FabG [Geminicoccaceae bacterium]
MRRALVTGGSGDLGGAICKRLAADGLEVIVHANSHLEKAEQIAGDIRAEGGTALAAAFDVTDPEATKIAVTALLDKGPIQVIVNNAGIHADAPMAGMSFEQWRGVCAVSLDGFFNVTQPLLLPMLRTRWGRVIAVSSISALFGNRGQVNYAAAKGALHGAIRSLAREIGSRGATANVVAPGLIESKSIDERFDAKTIGEMVPMKRAGRPEEVADVIGFLASEQASYVSGQVIAINGGMG